MKKILIKFHRCETASLRDVVSHLFFVIALPAALLILPSCKTTVKNYQAAYDVAIQKKEREDSARREIQREMGLSTELAQDAEGFSKMTLNGEEFHIYRKNFQRKDSVDAYALCVASFKMPANAASMSEDLQSAGFPHTRSAESAGKFYVLIDSRPEMEQTVEILRQFRKRNPEWRYVGVPGATIIIGQGKK